MLDKFHRRKGRVSDQMDVCHGDEKWFYLLRDGTACRVSPNFEESNEGVDRIVTMPADPKLFHNLRTPKVMFLAVTARPRIEYGFDGKIRLWPFTVARKARRSDVCIWNGCRRNGDHGECYRGCARISLCYAEEGRSF